MEPSAAAPEPPALIALVEPGVTRLSASIPEVAYTPLQEPDVVLPKGGSVTVRAGANLRTHPRGGGAVLRTLRRGDTMAIYDTAPGGWYQVGDPFGPVGWAHGGRLRVSPP
ncbi:SH3 domain-containing protein [Roseomonas sp. GCM10028921]